MSFPKAAAHKWIGRKQRYYINSQICLPTLLKNYESKYSFERRPLKLKTITKNQLKTYH
jgi:hypothetical protein